jgi:hypothetical protein
MPVKLILIFFYTAEVFLGENKGSAVGLCACVDFGSWLSWEIGANHGNRGQKREGHPRLHYLSGADL